MASSYPTRLQMPFLLLAGMGLSAFMAGVGAIAYTGMAVMLPFSSTYTMNGRDVSRTEFLSEMWPFFLLYPVVLGAFGLIAYGLWRELPWSREAMLAFWLVGGASSVVVQFMAPSPAGEFLAGLATYALLAGIAAWYLYGTETVRRYYRAIHSRHTTPSADGA